MTIKTVRSLPVVEIGLALLVATITFATFALTATHPPSRIAAETLEAANRASGPKTDLSVAPGDLEAARAFCTGALSLRIGDLERDVADGAQRYGLTQAAVHLGPIQRSSGLATAQVLLTLEGPQENLGRALNDAAIWAPSIFFDVVKMAPTASGQEARLDAQARILCLAP